MAGSTAALGYAVGRSARLLIAETLAADVCIAVPSEDGALKAADDDPAAAAMLAEDRGVARWAFEHGQKAGRDTNTLPGSQGQYLPLATVGGVVGVLGVRLRNSDKPIDPQSAALLDAFARQTAAAIDRCNAAQSAEEIRLRMETERLRNSLLSSVSHDLRTPLATIVGAASILAERGEQLAPAAREELSSSIVAEADRLHRLVVNLLDITRLEAGAVTLQREWQPIEEVIGAALRRIERHAPGRRIVTHFADHLPPVRIDALLMEQVLINLLDNALRFALPDSAIDPRRNDSSFFNIIEAFIRVIVS